MTLKWPQNKLPATNKAPLWQCRKWGVRTGWGHGRHIALYAKYECVANFVLSNNRMANGVHQHIRCQPNTWMLCIAWTQATQIRGSQLFVCNEINKFNLWFIFHSIHVFMPANYITCWNVYISVVGTKRLICVRAVGIITHTDTASESTNYKKRPITDACVRAHDTHTHTRPLKRAEEQANLCNKIIQNCGLLKCS